MSEEEKMTLQFHDATLSDIDGVRQVQQHTWLATYPNSELGITKEDIEAQFHASSEKAIKRRQTQQQRINRDHLVHLWVAKEAERIVGFCLAKREVTQNRIQAITFYRRFGFVSSGRPAHSGVTKLTSGAVIPEIELVKRDTHNSDTSGPL